MWGLALDDEGVKEGDLMGCLLAVCVCCSALICTGWMATSRRAAAHKVPLTILSSSESLHCFPPSPLHRLLNYYFTSPVTHLASLLCMPVLFALLALFVLLNLPGPYCVVV